MTKQTKAREDILTFLSKWKDQNEFDKKFEKKIIDFSPTEPDEYILKDPQYLHLTLHLVREGLIERKEENNLVHYKVKEGK